MDITLRPQASNEAEVGLWLAEAGARVSAVTEQDLSLAYQSFRIQPLAWPRLARPNVPNFLDFRERIWHSASGLYRVDELGLNETSVPIGFVGLYGHDPIGRVIWVERLGLGGKVSYKLDAALASVTRRALQVWPIRKLYVEYFDLFPSAFSRFDGVVQEGRLVDHGVCGGSYCSLVYESIEIGEPRVDNNNTDSRQVLSAAHYPG